MTPHLIVAFLLMLGPLVAVHEFGHYWVARRAGVKVMVFSIGFGPVVYKWLGKNGTQYQIAAIPLGGYVKMADEREGEVAPDDLPFAFNRQSVYKRMAIVAAGPLINFLFAILLFWVLFLPDEKMLNSRIGEVEANSPASQAGLVAGDNIIAVDGQPVQTAEALQYAMINRVGDTGSLQLTLERSGQSTTAKSTTVESTTASVPIQNFLNAESKDPFETLGFYPYQPQIAPVIKEIVANGPADKQGLKAGDTFLSINAQPVSSAVVVKRLVTAAPNTPLAVTVARTIDGARQTISLTLTPASKTNSLGVKQGFLQFGFVVPQQEIPQSYQQAIHRNPLQALVAAVDRTWQMSVMSVTSIGKLITGKLHLNNLSGIITIANVSDDALSMGWERFFHLMAMMSISLGVMNLLPIPVLDGGHLTFYAMEAVLGRPVSVRTQERAMKVGFVMLMGLMGVAFYYDFLRYDIINKVLALFNDVAAML